MRAFATVADAQGASNLENGEIFLIGTGAARYSYIYDSANQTAGTSTLGDAVLTADNGRLLLITGQPTETLPTLGSSITVTSGNNATLPAATRGYSFTAKGGGVYFALGGGSVTATSADSWLPQNSSKEFRTKSGQTDAAAFNDGSGGELKITALDL